MDQTGGCKSSWNPTDLNDKSSKWPPRDEWNIFEMDIYIRTPSRFLKYNDDTIQNLAKETRKEWRDIETGVV